MDIEAYDAVIDLLGQSHQYGDSIAAGIQIWVSVSFAVIGAAYFAPERLGLVVVLFVLAIYVAFTAHTFALIDTDVRASAAALADAERLASIRGLELELLSLRTSPDPVDRSGSPLASQVFIFGLFFGVIGFVIGTSFEHYRKKSD